MQCSECKSWAGTCLQGKMNKTADSSICELFEPRIKKHIEKGLLDNLLDFDVTPYVKA